MTKRKQPKLSTLRQPASVPLLDDIRQLIVDTRVRVAAAVNAGLTLLYWQIGQRIRKDALQEKRAEYGEEILPTVSAQLVPVYQSSTPARFLRRNVPDRAPATRNGQSFAEKNLRRMMQFASIYPDKQNVVSLIRHLSWTHFLAMLPLKASLQRDFYAEICRLERWSVHTLRQKINAMLYERTALSKKPYTLIHQELDTRCAALTYLYIRESLPPECAQAIPGIQANVDMREALTPTSPMSGMDILALPDKEEMHRFLEAQMAEEMGSEAAENLEDCT